jgi:DNA polymerase III subunit epsilon
MLSVDRSTRLADVTFCVLDLETTGTSDEVDEIVEVGAVLVRGGQRLGTFQTLVRHSLAAGPSDRPRIEPVLASLLEFVRGAVIVGHNVRFDLRFLNAALWKAGHDVILDPADAIDTMPLARRLLRDDADDCRLGTLAQRFQFDHRPTHRAFADAASTVELLHLVIERATHYGAADLDDLARLAGLMRHRHRSKLALTAALPRAAGAACLLDRHDQVLHVVVADDLRHGVRRLFDTADPQGRPRGAANAVLQHLHRITSIQTDHPVVAELASLRWAAAMPPPRGAGVVYLQLTATRPGRLRVVSDRLAPGVVAGPYDRLLARQAVAHLAALPIDHTHAFVAALGADDASCTAHVDGVLRSVIAHHRAIEGARARRGSIEVDGAAVTVDDGRVVDVVTAGRSWADELPGVVAGDRPRLAPTPGRAREAMFVAQLSSGGWSQYRRQLQPGCEILEI